MLIQKECCSVTARSAESLGKSFESTSGGNYEGKIRLVFCKIATADHHAGTQAVMLCEYPHILGSLSLYQWFLQDWRSW